MICPNCNNNTDENAKFCVNCGYNLSKADIANNNINNGTLASDSISTVSSNNSSFTNDSMNIANNSTLTNGNIETTSSSNNTYMNGEMNKKPKKGHKGLIITIIIILILAIAGVSAFLLLKDSDKDSDNKEVNNTETKNTNNTGNSNNGNNNNGNNNNGNNNNGNSNNNNSGKNNNTANSFVTDFDNYNIELEMNMTINGMEMITTATGTVDQVNQKEYLDMKMSVMGMNVDMEAYTDYKSGITYMTEPFTNNWTKQTGASQTVDLNNILNLLTSMNNVTKIDNNHYKVKISPNEMQGLLATSDVDTSIISGDIEADVYVENGYIKELDYDFTNMIDGFDKFTVKMKISNYDKAGNVTIPNDVIKNATEA